MKIDDLKKKYNITDGEIIQYEDFDSILEDVSKNNITKHEANEILRYVSNITDLQLAYLDTVKETITAAKEVQQTAMNKISIPNVAPIIKIIENMLINTDDLVFKEKVLGKLMELSTLMYEYEEKKNNSAERMNNDNNKFWSKLIIGVGIIIGGAVAAIASTKINSKRD